jgi:hypothetical protein
MELACRIFCDHGEARYAQSYKLQANVWRQMCRPSWPLISRLKISTARMSSKSKSIFRGPQTDSTFPRRRFKHAERRTRYLRYLMRPPGKTDNGVGIGGGISRRFYRFFFVSSDKATIAGFAVSNSLEPRFGPLDDVPSFSTACRTAPHPLAKYLDFSARISFGGKPWSFSRRTAMQHQLRVFCATPPRNRSNRTVTWAVLRCVGELLG